MPVRIIFRGLMLYQFPTTGDDAGKLVVLLVDNKSVTRGSSQRDAKDNRPHGPWEHHHNPDYQVLSDQQGQTNIVPKKLTPGLRMDITVPTPAGRSAGVIKSRSFLRHVPNLDNIIERGTSPAIRRLAEARGPARLGDDLVSNIVKVNRGTVFVRDIVMWDESAYPLSGNAGDVGERARTPALAKFMGSNVSGHMVSEVIVQVDDASEVDIGLGPKGSAAERHKGYGTPNPYVPEQTVEIVITNYEYQRGSPVPWSMDFQWLFEVAGYGEAELGGREFDAWLPFASRYNRDVFESDRAMLLGGGTTGRPFPYLESYDTISPLTPLSNVLERPLCSSGTTTTPISGGF